jgi:hypothetical protein
VNVIVTNYTPADLKKLPLRAIVALAARSARRVERQARLPDDHPQKERCRTAVAGAIALAEAFASDSPCSSLEAVVQEVEACRKFVQDNFERDNAVGAAILAAHAAETARRSIEMRAERGGSNFFGSAAPNPFPHLADVTAELAAADAFLAAFEAVGVEGHTDAFVMAAVEDYEKLLRLDLGSFPDAGKPLDLSSKGPLGPWDTLR